MSSRKAITLCVCLLWLGRDAGHTADNAPTNTLPGVTRQTNNVFLIENHSTALLILHASGIRGATLVHVDAHDDLRHIQPMRMAAIKTALASKDYPALHRASDESLVQGFEVRRSQQLFDLGNWLYPAVMEGIVTNLIWVVPDRELGDARIRTLSAHMAGALHERELRNYRTAANSFFFSFQGVLMQVTTLDALQAQGTNVVLDIDSDFFALPTAMTEEHTLGGLTHPLQNTLYVLAQKTAGRSLTIVASSTEGGYLPVALRVIPDAGFEFFSTGAYPSCVDELLGAYVGLQTNVNISLPGVPSDGNYVPAHKYIAASALVLMGDPDGALPLLKEAAAAKGPYRKGILDLAEVLLVMGRPVDVDRFIEAHDALGKGPTIGSDILRWKIAVANDRRDEAARISSRLAAWDRNSLMLGMHAVSLARQGRLKESRAIAEEALVLSQGNSMAHFGTGLSLELEGDFENAGSHYRKAIAIRRNFAEAYEQLGKMLLRNGQSEAGIGVLTEETVAIPYRLTPLVLLGQAWSAGKNHEKALDNYEKAIYLSRLNAELHLSAAVEAAAIKNWPKVRQHCTAALKLKPDMERAKQLLRTLPD